MAEEPLEIGEAIWEHLCSTFIDVMRARGYTTQAQKAQIWGGFIAAIGGSMCADLGDSDAKVVFACVQMSLDAATRERVNLKLVPGAPK